MQKGLRAGFVIIEGGAAFFPPHFVGETVKDAKISRTFFPSPFLPPVSGGSESFSRSHLGVLIRILLIVDETSLMPIKCGCLASHWTGYSTLLNDPKCKWMR